MNGPYRSRRTASPVRLCLGMSLGGEIDGAWWPRTGTMVGELPDLIEVLHPRLGEIVDISLNWLAGSAAPVLGGIPAAIAAKAGRPTPGPRLMSLAGRTATARLLVVPSTTSADLALMVLRQAGARPIPGGDRSTPVYEAADRIVRAAQAASASWQSQER